MSFQKTEKDENRKALKHYRTVEQMLEDGWDINLGSDVRRLGEPGTPERDFYNRFTYTAETVSKSDKEIKIESPWEGFETSEECIVDMLKAASAYIKRK